MDPNTSDGNSFFILSVSCSSAEMQDVLEVGSTQTMTSRSSAAAAFIWLYFSGGGNHEGIAWGITIPFFLGLSLLISYLLDRSKG